MYMICGSHSAVLSRSVFWDITKHNIFEVNKSFGGTYRLHVRVPKLNWLWLQTLQADF
jgi:hypothetical protein